MEKWARVGMTIEVDEKLWEKDQEEAVMDAFRKGKVKLDGETYFPEEASENDGTEDEMNNLSGTVILAEREE
ncbi:hypothetical protein ACWKTZ_22180 [Bacillus cereus]|uniref:hypothetical protein n=1 Tax=Bacillus cereus TaxID=1396 RepID=UPI0030792028